MQQPGVKSHACMLFKSCEKHVIAQGSKFVHDRRSRSLITGTILRCMQRRLISPFDIHATLLHLINYPARPALPDWSDVSSPVRPLSLLEEIPTDRSCDEAGIKAEDCGQC